MKLLHVAKKSLGQNFLIDKNIISKIIKIGDINRNKTVIEIGAGYGNLTTAINLSNIVHRRKQFPIYWFDYF